MRRRLPVASAPRCGRRAGMLVACRARRMVHQYFFRALRDESTLRKNASHCTDATAATMPPPPVAPVAGTTRRCPRAASAPAACTTPSAPVVCPTPWRAGRGLQRLRLHTRSRPLPRWPLRPAVAGQVEVFGHGRRERVRLREAGVGAAGVDGHQFASSEGVEEPTPRVRPLSLSTEAGPTRRGGVQRCADRAALHSAHSPRARARARGSRGGARAPRRLASGRGGSDDADEGGGVRRATCGGHCNGGA